jgi:transcriptional regulator with XRE-family HTH domain
MRKVKICKLYRKGTGKVIKTQLFSERLKQLREEQNISVKDLGERCGTSGATISRYETGVHEPKSNMVQKLADFFNVNPAWLMGADVNRNGEETIISYDNPVVFAHLDKDLQEFVAKEESTPYIILAKNLSAYDPDKLTEREFKLMVEWLRMAIKESNN